MAKKRTKAYPRDEAVKNNYRLTEGEWEYYCQKMGMRVEHNGCDEHLSKKLTLNEIMSMRGDDEKSKRNCSRN